MKPRFTPEEAEEIRARYAKGGITQRQFAQHFGVSLGVIRNLLHKVTYHPEGRRVLDTTGGRVSPSRSLTPEQVQDIRLRRINGEKFKNIAEEYDVLIGTVYQIVEGKTYRNVPRSEAEIARLARQEEIRALAEDAKRRILSGELKYPTT